MRNTAKQRADIAAPESVERSEAELTAALGNVSRELAGLNRELASQMVLLASQTGNPESLIGAVQALRKVKDYYAHGQAPRENAEVHEALADTLFALGRAKGDVESLEHSVLSYRSAITMASLLGDESMRRRLRKNYKLAQAALGSRGDISSIRVA